MRSFATALAAALCAIMLLQLPACVNSVSRPHPAPAAPTGQETGALVAGHKAKDKTIIAAAAEIDALVSGTPAAPSVGAKTSEQRAAVAAAPAEQITEILGRFDRAIAGFEALVKEKDKTIAEQAAQIATLKDAELRAQVRAIRLAGLACLGVAALLGFVAKNLPGAGVAGGLGFLALAVAQAWLRVASHPAFIPTVVGLVIAGLGGLTWACVHAYRKGDLARKTEREAARLRDTLGKVVPVLDAAYENAEQSTRDLFDRSIFSRLSSLFGKEEKAVVHEIRAASAK
jgi:hypothetical protein